MNVAPVAKAPTNFFSNAPTEPINSSLMRLGNNVSQGFQNSVQTMNNGFKSVNNGFKNFAKNVTANVKPNVKNTTVETPFWAIPVAVFLSLVIGFTIVFVFFAKEIRAGYDNLLNAVRGSMGVDSKPPVVVVSEADVPTTAAPVKQTHEAKSILEKVLPLSSAPEVFNVSKNDFSYYDAEPLCKALGAELATYDQVKQAYERGADWCNYGWVKGQMAIYPTQKSTWDEIQKGPEEEHGACGKPGLNGGYFDNPELKFGVNCYGSKPNQSAHDEAELMKKGHIPQTVAALKIDQKTQAFLKDIDTVGVLPFNTGKWSSE